MQTSGHDSNLALSNAVHPHPPSSVPEQPLGQPLLHTAPTNILAGPSSQQMHPPLHWNGSDDPEPLTGSELHSIQTRLSELGLISGPPEIPSTVSTRESELLQMILRLASHASALPDPSQLTVQAETIAGLTHQRNFLLTERAEEQKRWEAEREGFDRVAEALISKRKASAGTRVLDDETQRHISRLEDDNKALKNQLNQTQQRMSALESDLNRLRPLLVMQTIASRPDALAPTLKTLPIRRKRKPQQQTPQPDRDDQELSFSQATESLVESDITSSQSAFLSRPKSHYRFAEMDTSQSPARKGKKTRTPPLPPGGFTAGEALRFKPILADARSEMLLSAAKKIGRTRTGILAGVVRSGSPEPKVEKEKEVEGRKRKPQGKGKHKANPTAGPSTLTAPTRRTQSVTNLAQTAPRTPRRTATVPNLNATPGSTQHPSHLHPSTTRSHPEIVYINPGSVPPVTIPMPVIVPFASMSAQGGTAWPATLPTQVTPTTNRIQHQHQSLRTPTSNTRTPKNRNAAADDEASPQGQGTPFNSLLNAARSIMVEGVFDDYDEDSRTDGGATPRANTVDPYTPTRPRRQTNPSESPLAKRRKLDSANTPSRSQASSSVTSTPNKGGLTRGPPTRVRSALDVLADQAAQEQERRPSVDGGSQRPSAEPDPSESTPAKSTGKGKAVDRLTDDERNIRRPPSAPPPFTSISIETTLVDLRASRSSSQHSADEEEVPTRPATPNASARTVSEEPSPSQRVRAVPVNTNEERRDLRTPRKITVISVQPSGSGAEQ